MDEERVIDRLRKGKKVLCSVCKKHYYDNSDDNREFYNYFHCEDENCQGSVHEQKAIDVG